MGEKDEVVIKLLQEIRRILEGRIKSESESEREREGEKEE